MIAGREQHKWAYHGVVEDLPFRSGSFDYALMVTTVCFVDLASPLGRTY